MVILSTATEDQASDWIMKLCQTVAGSSDFLYTTLCPAARAIPCCVAVTKQHIVTFHAHINGEYRFLSSFYIQDITMILVDNEVRNYCVLVSFDGKIFSARSVLCTQPFYDFNDRFCPFRNSNRTTKACGFSLSRQNTN